MCVINWLLERVFETDGRADMTLLYESYRLESIDSGLTDLVERRFFVDILQRLFPKAISKKIRQGESVKKIYEGIQLKALEPLQCCTDTFSFEKLKSVLPTDFEIKKENVDCIECRFETEFKSNGCNVQKIVSFHKDSTFSVIIGEKNVDLKVIGIHNKFSCNKNSVNLACDIVRKLELCHGIEMKKSIRCTRFHILETWKSNCNVTSKRIRSVMCARVVKFTSKTNVCRTCQKMTTDIKNCDKENIQLDDQNTATEISKVNFQKMIPGAPDEMLDFLVSQAKNVSKSPNGRRWSNSVMSKCLQLYSKNPHAYKMLRDSRMVVLPSPGVIILYKNQVKHEIGFQEDIFRWMHMEARRLDLPAEAWEGGILVDEMSIQEDVQISKHGDVVELTGFEDVGYEGNTCSVLRKGKKEVNLGNHALQFIFLGVSGFRFPFAHFISTNVQAYELHMLFWEAVDHLEMYGFKVSYVSMDGAQSNRTFMHMNIGKNATSMIARNPSNFNNSIVFIMDSSHVFKKVRNNLLKSGILKGCTRHLHLPSGDIINWQMWADAYTWDKCNALQIHRKLTNEHIFPTTQSKMRNHLAEQVLNTEMLHLMQQFQISKGNQGEVLNGAIELLKRTSKMIEILRDMRPVRLPTDERLTELSAINDWFENWSANVSSTCSADKMKKLFSQQCLEDIRSCILGFCELCKITLNQQTSYIVPALINSDAVENHFCQQRSTYNGANTNPNALQYRNNQNSIILGQNIISQRSNTGKSLKSPALAYGQSQKKVSKRRNSDTDNKSKIKVLRL